MTRHRRIGFVQDLTGTDPIVLVGRQRESLFPLLYMARRGDLVMQRGERGGRKARDFRGRQRGFDGCWMCIRQFQFRGTATPLHVPGGLDACIFIDGFQHRRRSDSNLFRHPREPGGRHRVGGHPGAAQQEHQQQPRGGRLAVVARQGLVALRRLSPRRFRLELRPEAEIVGHGEIIPWAAFHGEVIEIREVGGISGRAGHRRHRNGFVLLSLIGQDRVLPAQIARFNGMAVDEFLFLQRQVIDIALQLLVGHDPTLLLPCPIRLSHLHLRQRIL